MDNETIWLFIKVFTLLPLILVLAYITIKYGLARTRGFTIGTRYMRRVDHLPLGPKAGLTLVEVGGRYYLVAFQENSISLLKEFDTLPESISASSPATGSVTNFKDILYQHMKQTQQYLSGKGRKGKSGSGCPASGQKEKD
ncbi:hypothetical protein Dred_2397 [Desulforamulus reducens MI-1]|uniref:Flagellar protein n=1 Tax=Desulforamulus reducens (strain ATCC BAA-1160 / DSM 100696 / MI-1) TaxID=349161 RepID=A4J754_DESRM|nr:flagellar biosynthetic protein FliO [Desulforamulus reducens]ABO50907.1 hypothetical protein Dred_2397 [Desulforamulus reducens MI-1]